MQLNIEEMKNIPYLGAGIGFRSELKPLIFLNRDKIRFVEIIADHYIDAPREKQDELVLLKKHFTVIPHALDLSIGSTEGIDPVYLRKLKALIEFIDPPYWSDHISYTKAHGIDIGHLAPIIFNDDFLDVLTRNIAIIKQTISQPLILENITYHVEIPGRTYSDADFLNRVCEQTGCGLLLDLTNLYINSRNHKFDPFLFINELNKENVVQLHYVGYESKNEYAIDTHSAATQPEIFNLMAHLFKTHRPKGVLLERDEQFDKHSEIIEDLQKANELLLEYQDAG